MSDTLAALQTALAPKTGLHPIPLASQSYEYADPPASAERLLNMFAEKLPASARSPFQIKSTPGNELLTTLGAGPVFSAAALANLPDVAAMWAISSDHAYWIRLGFAPVDLGVVGLAGATFGRRANQTSIAIGNTGVVFCVPPRAYVTDLLGAPVQQITTGTGNFPAGGCSSVCYIDGYYVFTSLDGSQFFVSNLLDATHFNSLAFFQSSSFTDYMDFCTPHNGDLWLFGQIAAQAFYDTGDPTEPFSPRPGAVVKHGLGSPGSVVEIDGSLIFLGIDKVIYRINGYVATRISTHPIEEHLNAFIEGAGGFLIGAVKACGFVHAGHAFYAITIPSVLVGPFNFIGRTYVYDCGLGLWHERSSGATGPWLISTATGLGSRLVLGDAVNGSLYQVNAALGTENGVAMTRVATLPILAGHGPRTFMNRLEIEMDVGTTGNTIQLDWSDDGGINYKAPRTLGTGASGATRTRVATTRLGSFYSRVLRLTTTGKVAIYGVDADIPPRAA